MVVKKIYSIYICLFLLILPTQASAFDTTKLHCLRQEKLSDRIYLSEIHFKKAGVTANRHRYQIMNAPNNIEGEVISYSLNGSVKKYISGYNLFSVSYRDEVISGLTGDPVTSADGVFTLSRLNQRNSGLWKFVYTNRNGVKIDADFKCVYGKSDTLKN